MTDSTQQPRGLSQSFQLSTRHSTDSTQKTERPSHPSPLSTRSSPRRPPVTWDADRVRGLRRSLRFTQRQLADELGVRQQTVSEWETGAYRPRGASARLLDWVAERASLRYGERPERDTGVSQTGPPEQAG